MAVRQGREPWEGRARVRLGGPGARQGRVPVPHSTAPFSLGGHPRGVAGMGPGLTRLGRGGCRIGTGCSCPPPPRDDGYLALNFRHHIKTELSLYWRAQAEPPLIGPSHGHAVTAPEGQEVLYPNLYNW